MTGPSLPRFYENPATSFGLPADSESVRRQASLVSGIAARAGRAIRVADIGCGDGNVAAAVMAEVKRLHAGSGVVGFDWSSTALEQATALGVVAVRASVDGPGLPLADHSQDVVIMSELLEHLVDTDAALVEARRVLRPGGSLVLSTPNLAAWYNRVLLVLGIQPVFSEVSLYGIYGRPGHEIAGHLRLFTKRALAELLAANGFRHVSITGAPYHDVPRPFRGLDRFLCRFPGLTSILLVVARAD